MVEVAGAPERSGDVPASYVKVVRATVLYDFSTTDSDMMSVRKDQRVVVGACQLVFCWELRCTRIHLTRPPSPTYTHTRPPPVDVAGEVESDGYVLVHAEDTPHTRGLVPDTYIRRG